MEVVIVGDIVGSKKNNAQDYLEIIIPILKQCCDKGMYQIYRGDSFQARIKNPVLALYISLKLKAALKSTGSLDVRIAIGMGDIELVDGDIALSRGTALTRSGELLDSLKERNQKIMVRADHKLDSYMNATLKMALLFLDNWNKNAASIVYEIMNNPQITQEKLGERLGIQQATASRRLDRAHWKETQELFHLFQQYYTDVRDGAIC